MFTQSPAMQILLRMPMYRMLMSETKQPRMLSEIHVPKIGFHGNNKFLQKDAE